MAKKGGVIAVSMNGAHWEGTFDLVVKRMEEEKVVELKYNNADDELFVDQKARLFVLYKLWPSFPLPAFLSAGSR